MDMTRLLLLIIATVLVVLWIWLAKKYEAEFKDLTDSMPSCPVISSLWISM